MNITSRYPCNTFPYSKTTEEIILDYSRELECYKRFQPTGEQQPEQIRYQN